MTPEHVPVTELRAGDKIRSPYTQRVVRVKRVEQPVLGLFRVFISDRPYDCHEDRHFKRVERAPEPDPPPAPLPAYDAAMRQVFG